MVNVTNATCSDFADQAPDVLGAASDLAGSAVDLAGSAADLAGSAKSSFGESLGSIGDVWGSVVDSFSSAKDQVNKWLCRVKMIGTIRHDTQSGERRHRSLYFLGLASSLGSPPPPPARPLSNNHPWVATVL